MTEEHCDSCQLEADVGACLLAAVASAEHAAHHLNAAIRRCHAGGLSLRAIAAVTGDSPETVRKIVRAG